MNNQLITISFMPASQSDQDTLSSFAVIDPTTGELVAPSSISAYLVHVIPELRINGKTVLTGEPVTLGTDVTFVFSPSFAGRSTYQYTYNFAAGSYAAFATVAGNVAPIALANIQQQLQDIVNYENRNTQSGAPIPVITNDTTVGNMFEAGLLGYYLQYIEAARLLGLSQGGDCYLAAGIGSYGIEPEVKYTFGIPQSIHGADIVLNLPIINIIGYDNSDTPAKFNYVFEVGLISSLYEYIMPNQMFPNDKLGGASAVTAIAAASAQGQRIYNINQLNQSSIMPQIHLNSLAMSEINSGLATGKQVITETNTVNTANWSGAGYIIYDPITGDGAYKIAGGANGWKGEFNPTFNLYQDFWQILLFGFEFIKTLRLSGMIVEVAGLITELHAIYKHCSGALYVRYTLLFSLLAVMFIALAAFAGPAVVLLGSLIAPWVTSLALDMAIANCDSRPNG